MVPTRSAPSSRFTGAGGSCKPCNGQGSSRITSMSGTGSSSLMDPTSGGPHFRRTNASLVTDANSAPADGARPSEPCSQFPASPPSFSSNPMYQEQLGQQKQEPENANPLKRLKVEANQEKYFQTWAMQLPNQRLDSLPNLQLQALINEQHRRTQLQQEQQQSIAQPYRCHQNAQQPHLVPTVQNTRPPFKEGMYARLLMQFMDDQRRRPTENSIKYWMKFVKKYYVPRAKIKWCFSSYAHVSNRALGVLPRTDVEALTCDLCRSRAGKAFEVNVDVLPRLHQIKFDHGVIDELLFLDKAQESPLSSGIMMLESVKAVQVSVYEQYRVVRNGRIRVFFTPYLKIMNWEFCSQPHEVFLSHRYVAPQVNQFLRVAQKYQASLNESGSSGVPHQDLEVSCNMFLSASHQLAKSLELPSLNASGFSRRYVRFLQIYQAVSSMKDVIDFSLEHKMAPLESYNKCTQQTAAKFETQKMLTAAQGLHSADENSLNKTIAIQPGTRSYNLNNSQVTGVRGSSGNPNQNSLQYINPNLAHLSILANNSVDSSSCPRQNNQQCSEVDEKKVIQLMLQELRNNKDALQQLAGRPLSNVVAPNNSDAGLIRNGTNVEPLAVYSPNSNIVGSEPRPNNNFPSIDSSVPKDMHLPR